MTTPRTRLDEADNDFERDLLRSWDHERPSPRAAEKALAAISGGALLTTTAAAGAGVTTAVKIGLAAALVLVVSGGVVVATTSHETAPAPVASAMAPPPPPPLPVVTAVATPEPEPTIETPPPVRVVVPSRAAPAVTVVASAEPKEPEPPPKANARALGEQVALIDRARKTLEGGDAAEALRTLDDYDARFAGGALSQEATVLRIEALLRQGRRQDAQDLGDRFIASRPKSPYATKIRRLLDTP